MNWVGGARNRLKLKHENKLQKEFFERKRQLKGNTKTAPVAKKIDKVTGRGSQDLFSLEVIMTAHKKDKKQRKADRIHTSQKSSHTNHECSEKPCRQDHVQSKQLQHILPELSPARQQLQAANLEEGKCGNFCSDHLKKECIFTSMPLGRQTDEHEAMAGRQAVPTAMNDEEKLGTLGSYI